MCLSKESMINKINKTICDGEKVRDNFINLLVEKKIRELRLPPLFAMTTECVSTLKELKDNLYDNNLQNCHIDNAIKYIQKINKEKKFLYELYEEKEPWNNKKKEPRDQIVQFQEKIEAYLEWIDDLSFIEDSIENLRNRCSQGGNVVNNIGNVGGSVQIQQNVVNSSQNMKQKDEKDIITILKPILEITKKIFSFFYQF